MLVRPIFWIFQNFPFLISFSSFLLLYVSSYLVLKFLLGEYIRSLSFIHLHFLALQTITFYLFCLKFFLRVYVCACVCYINASAGRSQKRASDSCSWNYRQLWAAQHGCWELGMGLQFSGAANSFNHWAIFPVPVSFILEPVVNYFEAHYSKFDITDS